MKVWEALGNPNHIFYAVTQQLSNGPPIPIISLPDETVQEPYVVEKFQEEALILMFTTKQGAVKHLEYLVGKCGYDQSKLGLVNGNIKTLWEIVDILNQKVVQELGRSVRAEVYHMDGDDCTDYDIIYSHWIPKH